MRRILLSAAFLLAAFTFVESSRAARNLETGSISGPSLELVVFEIEGCAYCPVFRSDVLPGYQLSQHAKDAPIRFVDVNDPAADRIGLDGDITMVPTVVLLKGNREVGRIPGYTGPESFFQLVKHLIMQAGGTAY